MRLTKSLQGGSGHWCFRRIRGPEGSGLGPGGLKCQDVMIHAVIDSGKSAAKKHPCYPAAKSGDADSARTLARETISDEHVEALRRLLAGRRPMLVSVHAYESDGV